MPRGVRNDSDLCKFIRHDSPQLRHARRLEFRFYGLEGRIAAARGRRISSDVCARHADRDWRVANAEAHFESWQARDSARGCVLSVLRRYDEARADRRTRKDYFDWRSRHVRAAVRL